MIRYIILIVSIVVVSVMCNVIAEAGLTLSEVQLGMYEPDMYDDIIKQLYAICGRD